MTPEQLAEINKLLADGVKQTELPDRFGIGSYNTFVQRLAKAGYSIAPQLVPLRIVPISVVGTDAAVLDTTPADR